MSNFFYKLIDDNLVVIDVYRWELIILNNAAAQAWLLLSRDNISIDDITEYIFDNQITFTFDKPDLKKYLKSFFQQLNDQGWVLSDKDEFYRLNNSEQKLISSHINISLETFNEHLDNTPCVYSENLMFIENSVQFVIHESKYPKFPDLAKRAIAFLSGLRHTNEESYETITIVSNEYGVFINRKETALEVFTAISALSRMVLWGFYAAFPDNQLSATIHSAALGKKEGMLLFPGLSGCGKTTLAAYLVTKQWKYAGDDIIGLSISKKNEVLPFQSALSIKEGSWEFLLKFYPEIEDSEIIPYSDKYSKFISVPRSSLSLDTSNMRIPKAIVFPKYDPMIKEVILEEISSTEALKKLIEVGIRTGEKLEHQMLEELFDFIIKIPKYIISYSSLESAEKTLNKLLKRMENK